MTKCMMIYLRWLMPSLGIYYNTFHLGELISSGLGELDLISFISVKYLTHIGFHFPSYLERSRLSDEGVRTNLKHITDSTLGIYP